ncbi:hypothetical protein IJ090_03575 [Candidatus Saccharibacteria bacterium]|nr:hypothetical protein [Candidatus Saccharibacteria bacterium]
MIKATDIHFGIKIGRTIDEYCEKYGYKSEDDLFRDVKILYPNISGDVISQMKQAGKRRTKQRNHRKGKEALVKQQTTPEVSLEAQEKKLSDEVIKLEGEHKSLAQTRRGYLAELRTIRSELSRIKAELKTLDEKYERTVKLNNETVVKMNAVSAKRTAKLEELDAIRAEIERNRKITVAVYEDCSLEILEGEQIELQFEADNAAVNKLVDTLACEELPVKQIRVVVKLLEIAKKDPRVEFEFDNEKVKEVFLMFKNQQVPA